MTEDELILTHILNCSRSELLLKKPVLTDAQQKEFEEIKSRRLKNEPLQYLLGICDFLGFELKVDSRVLVPRPETEILVDEAVKRVKHLKNIKILDLGTGSGNIAIALAKFLPDSHVTSVDISKDALDLAKENALRHGVQTRINFVCADMINFFDVETRQCLVSTYDLIISNPPYIPEEQIKTLPMDVQQEPELALKAGKDGLKFYRSIIQYSPCLLRAGAYLMMEFGDDQGLAVKGFILEQKTFSNIEILQDLNCKDRIISAQKI